MNLNNIYIHMYIVIYVSHDPIQFKVQALDVLIFKYFLAQIWFTGVIDYIWISKLEKLNLDVLLERILKETLSINLNYEGWECLVHVLQIAMHYVKC